MSYIVDRSTHLQICYTETSIWHAARLDANSACLVLLTSLVDCIRRSQDPYTTGKDFWSSANGDKAGFACVVNILEAGQGGCQKGFIPFIRFPDLWPLVKISAIAKILSYSPKISSFEYQWPLRWPLFSNESPQYDLLWCMVPGSRGCSYNI